MIFLQDGSFPKVGEFLRKKMRVFEHSHAFIFKAFVVALQGDRKLARKALAAGTYPMLKIVDEFPEHCGISGLAKHTAPAAFCNGTPNYFYFKTGFARGFETGNLDETDITRTLLHECVHWGRQKKGLPSRIHGNEAGDMFEYLAGYDTKLKDHSDHPGPQYQ